MGIQQPKYNAPRGRKGGEAYTAGTSAVKLQRLELALCDGTLFQVLFSTAITQKFESKKKIN